MTTNWIERHRLIILFELFTTHYEAALCTMELVIGPYRQQPYDQVCRVRSPDCWSTPAGASGRRAPRRGGRAGRPRTASPASRPAAAPAPATRDSRRTCSQCARTLSTRRGSRACLNENRFTIMILHDSTTFFKFRFKFTNRGMWDAIILFWL